MFLQFQIYLISNDKKETIVGDVALKKSNSRMCIGALH